MNKLPEQPKKILILIKGISQEGVSVTQIAKKLKASYGNVLKSVNKLENAGLVQKEKVTNRRIRIILTTKGKKLIPSFH